MVLSKLPVPGASYNLDYIRARAYCACNRCGGCLDIFTLIYPFLSSFSLSLGDGPIQSEILSQRAVKPKQPTNQRHALKQTEFWRSFLNNEKHKARFIINNNIIAFSVYCSVVFIKYSVIIHTCSWELLTVQSYDPMRQYLGLHRAIRQCGGKGVQMKR